jgi:hypothetical protein
MAKAPPEWCYLAHSHAHSAKKKSKKETSAYTRGLEKKSPQEQMVGADYSGWMKKKSSESYGDVEATPVSF